MRIFKRVLQIDRLHLLKQILVCSLSSCVTIYPSMVILLWTEEPAIHSRQNKDEKKNKQTAENDVIQLRIFKVAK